MRKHDKNCKDIKYREQYYANRRNNHIGIFELSAGYSQCKNDDVKKELARKDRSSRKCKRRFQVLYPFCLVSSRFFFHLNASDWDTTCNCRKLRNYDSATTYPIQHTGAKEFLCLREM